MLKNEKLENPENRVRNFLYYVRTGCPSIITGWMSTIVLCKEHQDLWAVGNSEEDALQGLREMLTMRFPDSTIILGKTD